MSKKQKDVVLSNVPSKNLSRKNMPEKHRSKSPRFPPHSTLQRTVVLKPQVSTRARPRQLDTPPELRRPKIQRFTTSTSCSCSHEPL